MAVDESPTAEPMREVARLLLGSDAGQLAVLTTLIQLLINQRVISAEQIISYLEKTRIRAGEQQEMPDIAKTIDTVILSIKRPPTEG